MPLTASPVRLPARYTAVAESAAKPSHPPQCDVVASELLRKPPAHTLRQGENPPACRPHRSSRIKQTGLHLTSRLTRTNPWTGLRKHKRKDSGTNSKSRSRIDGFQSPMVRILSLAPPRRFDLPAFSSHLHVDGLLRAGAPGCLHTLQSRA